MRFVNDLDENNLNLIKLPHRNNWKVFFVTSK